MADVRRACSEVSADRIRSLRSIIHIELTGVVLILLSAAMIAKGVGLLG